MSESPAAYAYLLGLYLGDGCVSRHARDVFRLRLFLDRAHPGIVEEAAASLRQLMPRNSVMVQSRDGRYAARNPKSYVEVSAYSKAWPCLLPQHGPARKHERAIELVEWQRALLAGHERPLLRGLIHSDGCRFINTGRNWSHPRYSFSNRSEGIIDIFCAACDRLGVHWTVAPNTVYVSRVADVARFDEFIGPKR